MQQPFFFSLLRQILGSNSHYSFFLPRCIPWKMTPRLRIEEEGRGHRRRFGFGACLHVLQEPWVCFSLCVFCFRVCLVYDSMQQEAHTRINDSSIDDFALSFSSIVLCVTTKS